MNIFKTKYSVEERQIEANRIRIKYPNRLPVIVTRGDKCTLNKIDKHKYLVPSDITLGQFIYVIRKRIKLGSEEGLYLFINNSILGTVSSLMADVYNNYKNIDNYLYISYHNENTFGN